MDILRRYDRRELTAAMCNTLNLPESTFWTIRKEREKITASIKAGAGSCATKVSSGQSTVMVRMEKMLVTWMDHRKRQGLIITFKKEETDPVPEFNTSTAWFYKFKTCYGFNNAKRSGEAKRAHKDAAASYPDRHRAIIEEGG